MLRTVRRLRRAYDLPVTANNEADFGTVGVQYVHYPWNTLPRPDVEIRWYHISILLPLYYRLCRTLSGFAPAGAQPQPHTRQLRLDGPARPSSPRLRVPYGLSAGHHRVSAGAMACARAGLRRSLSPEKRVERVIEIVAGVREQVPEAGLHIVGTPDDRGYARRVTARARAAGFVVHENFSRARLVDLVARQRYGIHGMAEEHFGMAPAELVRAGCIVWVPNGGGQVEIVADSRLTYDSVDDAIAKTVRTLRDPAEEAALRAHLATRAPLFSAERFMREIRAAVAEPAATP